MFKSLVLHLRDSMGGYQPVIDPSSFNDPIAMQTSWKMVAHSGGNIRVQTYFEVDHSRLEFRATSRGLINCIIFLFAGIAIAYFHFHSYDSNTPAFFSFYGALIVGSVSLLFIYISIHSLYIYTIPVVFDKNSGTCLKGHRAPKGESANITTKYYSRLEDIHALQIISKSWGHEESDYWYELNLVLKNSNRINVIGHGEGNMLRQNASRLSAFLKIPIWDAAE